MTEVTHPHLNGVEPLSERFFAARSRCGRQPLKPAVHPRRREAHAVSGQRHVERARQSEGTRLKLEDASWASGSRHAPAVGVGSLGEGKMIETGETVSQLREAGREMVAQGLTWGNAGNLSARLGGDTFLVTASGTHLGALSEGDFVPYPTPSNASRRPSKEVPMHQAVYEVRPEVNAVLHGAPLYSTLLACADLEPPHDLFVEAMYYLERSARVPYHHPGSAELGEAVREAAERANVLLLENHGVLVFDTGVAEALMALQALEFACRVVFTARSAGVPLRGLPPGTVEAFLDSGYRPRRKWPS